MALTSNLKRSLSSAASGHYSPQLHFIFLEDVAGSGHTWLPRAVPPAMKALASVGIFGSGIVLVTGESGNSGVLDLAKDARYKTQLACKKAEFTTSLAEEVFKLRIYVSDSFVMVKTKLAALKYLKPFTRKCVKPKIVTGKL